MQFRLRTLLIVLAVIGGCLGWLSWQMRIVANRQRISRQLEERGDGQVVYAGLGWAVNYEQIATGDPSQRPSLIRKWLGDESAVGVLFFSDVEKRPVVDAFPEADMYQ